MRGLHVLILAAAVTLPSCTAREPGRDAVPGSGSEPKSLEPVSDDSLSPGSAPRPQGAAPQAVPTSKPIATVGEEPAASASGPPSVPPTSGEVADGEEESRAGDPEIRAFDSIVIRRDLRQVEVEAVVCLQAGWLEQVLCVPMTREHESLAMTRARPSEIHAALIIAGFTPGTPGRWEYDGESVRVVPPTGDAIDVLVRYARDGDEVIEPIAHWIRDHLGEQAFPLSPWRFGGSQLRPNPPAWGPGEMYVADVSGSVIGLVTFGDEVLGFPEVLPDAVDVRPAEWEVNSDRVPPPGTLVTFILRPADGAEAMPGRVGR
jgi:hypothetical protein